MRIVIGLPLVPLFPIVTNSVYVVLVVPPETYTVSPGWIFAHFTAAKECQALAHEVPSLFPVVNAPSTYHETCCALAVRARRMRIATSNTRKFFILITNL